jgi:LPXTG-motif cell wall-anchored protein
MSYLQLAEDPYTRLAANDPKQLYVFVPAGFMGATQDTYIREDKFDNLPENQYQIIMQQLAPYQPAGLSDRASRRAARAEKKSARRDAKQKRVETRSAAISGALQKGGDLIKNLIGGGAGGSVDVQSGALDISYDTEPSFFEKNKTLVIVGGLAVLAGGVYLIAKKKKRK